MKPKENQPAPQRVEKGRVYCMICTHNVEADLIVNGRQPRVKPGQKCPRCSSTLDGGYVIQYNRAA
jgi:DNA-directed RNA polymerase subunit RPC12/RpoP